MISVANITPNMEDYMKTIYKLYRLNGDSLVHVSDIAADMRLRKASVCMATDVLAVTTNASLRIVCIMRNK